MGARTLRELAWVLAVAVFGLLLAALVAFSPWYAQVAAVEPEPPAGSPATPTQLVKRRASRIAAPPAWASTGLRSSSRTSGRACAKSATATMRSTRASTSTAGVPR